MVRLQIISQNNIVIAGIIIERFRFYLNNDNI